MGSAANSWCVGNARRSAIARRPTQLFVATAEDVVLAKLEWFRASGEVSERQWRDIVGVIKVQDEHLDRPYLQAWARRLGVESLLERALAASRD